MFLGLALLVWGMVGLVVGFLAGWLVCVVFGVYSTGYLGPADGGTLGEEVA